MENISVCENISLDLSASSLRYTLHPQILVAMATAMSLVSAFIVGSNVFLIIALVYSRYYGKYVNRTDQHSGFSDNKKILLISFYLLQLVIGAFCLPLAIVQVVGNGQWKLGPTFCMVRIYAESLTEVISIYHAVCMCLDTYTMIRKPFKYRLLTSKTGYGMALFSWAIPVSVFAFAMSLGWHTEGITEALHCLEAHHTCFPLMSKKFLLLILPISVAISLCTLLTIATLVLKEIHRFHQKQDLQVKLNNLRKLNFEGERSSKPSDLRSSDNSSTLNGTLPDQVSKFQSGAESEPPFQNHDSEISVSVIPVELGETETVSVENDTRKETVTGDNGVLNALPVNSKPNSKRTKVFVVVIIITSIQCAYLVALLIVFSLYVFDTKMFPLWLISYATWFRYVQCAMMLVITFKQKPVRKLVRAFLKPF